MIFWENSRTGYIDQGGSWGQGQGKGAQGGEGLAGVWLPGYMEKVPVGLGAAGPAAG